MQVVLKPDSGEVGKIWWSMIEKVQIASNRQFIDTEVPSHLCGMHYSIPQWILNPIKRYV